MRVCVLSFSLSWRQALSQEERAKLEVAPRRALRRCAHDAVHCPPSLQRALGWPRHGAGLGWVPLPYLHFLPPPTHTPPPLSHHHHCHHNHTTTAAHVECARTSRHARAAAAAAAARRRTPSALIQCVVLLPNVLVAKGSARASAMARAPTYVARVAQPRLQNRVHLGCVSGLGPGRRPRHRLRRGWRRRCVLFAAHVLLRAAETAAGDGSGPLHRGRWAGVD